jgi:hypothetical protein
MYSFAFGDRSVHTRDIVGFELSELDRSRALKRLSLQGRFRQTFQPLISDSDLDSERCHLDFISLSNFRPLVDIPSWRPLIGLRILDLHLSKNNFSSFENLIYYHSESLTCLRLSLANSCESPPFYHKPFNHPIPYQSNQTTTSTTTGIRILPLPSIASRANFPPWNTSLFTPYHASNHPLDSISLPFLISPVPSKRFPHSSKLLSASISRSRKASSSTVQTYCPSAPCSNTPLLPHRHILNSKSALRN